MNTSQHGFRGRLIAVEGLDGSGKSTQIDLLKKWLEAQHVKVFFTEWNSSEMVKQATRKGKKRRLLTPTTFSLIHATDFADRYDRQILPLIRGGYIVLADRYSFTAYARDVVRGCNEEWVRNLYRFAIQPDLTFYFRVPLEVALDRIELRREKLKYFEAGMDLKLSSSIQDSFKIFQNRIYNRYEALSEQEKFVQIDGTTSVESQQAQVRRMVADSIPLAQFKKDFAE